VILWKKEYSETDYCLNPIGVRIFFSKGSPKVRGTSPASIVHVYSAYALLFKYLPRLRNNGVV